MSLEVYCTDSTCTGCDYTKAPRDYSLGDCITLTPTSMPCVYAGEKAKKKEKKEATMSYAAAVNSIQMETPTDQKQRKYLLTRANDIFYSKKSDAKKTFGLEDSPQPKTLAEFIQFIKDDKFTVEEKYLDRRVSVYCAVDYIRFRDPSIKEDQAGYNTFKDTLKKAYAELQDDIAILEPKEGLEKLRAFEAATFH